MDRHQMLTIARPIEYLLSGISSTLAIITRFIRSVRVAHTDLAAVTRDLSDLRLILELLRDEPGVPFLLQGHMLPVLESCGNVLIQIDTILARCPEAAKWIELGRAGISASQTSLATFREALSLALQVASLYFPYSLQSSSMSFVFETLTRRAGTGLPYKTTRRKQSLLRPKSRLRFKGFEQRKHLHNQATTTPKRFFFHTSKPCHAAYNRQEYS
jgi:hypothetical protein